MAIRGSLGARRSELIRQMLTESLLLALAGGVLGCVFSYVGLKGIVTLIPDGMIPREVVIQLNIPVLLFSLGIAIFTALIFGLAPALHSANQNLVEPLKNRAGESAVASGEAGYATPWSLLEVALSLVLWRRRSDDADVCRYAASGSRIPAEQSPVYTPAIAQGQYKTHGPEAALLSPVAGSRPGASRSCGRDDYNNCPALRRHPQRDRHPGARPIPRNGTRSIRFAVKVTSRPSVLG